MYTFIHSFIQSSSTHKGCGRVARVATAHNHSAIGPQEVPTPRMDARERAGWARTTHPRKSCATQLTGRT